MYTQTRIQYRNYCQALSYSRASEIRSSEIQAPPSNGHPFLFQFILKLEIIKIQPDNKVDIAVLKVKRIFKC